MTLRYVIPGSIVLLSAVMGAQTYGHGAATTAPAQRVVVWDGEQEKVGGGWAHEAGSLKPQTTDSHSNDTALEFHVKSSAGIWVGAGWNWCAFKTGPYGTDVTGMNTFTFWVKKKGAMADIQINLLCNGKAFDMPEHHTEKVSVKTYCPQLDDGQWHEVVIPLADMKQPVGFDATHVGELHMFCAGDGDGSIFIDDIAFENRPAGK